MLSIARERVLRYAKYVKTAGIVVLYKTPRKFIEKAEDSLKLLGCSKVYFIDNSIFNRGFAQAVNLAAVKALKEGYELLCIANPDIELLEGTSKQIERAALKFDVFGGVMLQDNKIYLGGRIDKNNLAAGLNRVSKRKKGFFQSDFVSGSLFFVKALVFKRLDGFDERFFMYYEDVDFCYRARIAGFKVGITGDIYYKHYESSKSLQRKDKLLLEAWEKFVLKHGNLFQKFRAYLKILPQKFLKNRL